MSLKERISGGAAERFVEDYDTYYSVIFNSVYPKVNNFHDAEDICQEVFVRYFDNMESIECPRRWLFGCLRNVVFDHYKLKKKKEVNVDELFEDIGMGYVNGFRDARIMIKEVIQDICEDDGGRDASLFELVAVYNYSFVQASRQLNLNYKQARYRYSQFAAKVVQGLKERGVSNLEDLL